MALLFLQTERGHQNIINTKPWLKAQTPEIKKVVGAKITLINKWKREHKDENYREHLEEVFGYILPLCKCGCGKKVKNKNNLYLLGHNRPWLGKKRSSTTDITKKKQSDSHLGKKYTVTEEGHKILSDNAKKPKLKASIEKMQMALTGRKLSNEHMVTLLKDRLPTSLENKIITLIKEYGLAYKWVGNGSFLIGGYNPDFVNINGEKIAIEVYYSYYKTNKGADDISIWKNKRINIFKSYGWDIIFFDEKQIKDKNLILNLLQNRR